MSHNIYAEFPAHLPEKRSVLCCADVMANCKMLDVTKEAVWGRGELLDRQTCLFMDQVRVVGKRLQSV